MIERGELYPLFSLGDETFIFHPNNYRFDVKILRADIDYGHYSSVKYFMRIFNIRKEDIIGDYDMSFEEGDYLYNYYETFQKKRNWDYYDNY
jgi:hypothetical protein